MGRTRKSSDAAIAHNQSNVIETTNHHQIPHLPEKIIEDILSRLPVKSLLKFRCVSKSWLSLISSRQFVKTHLKSSSMSSHFANHNVMFASSENRLNLKQCSISSLMSKNSAVVASDVDYPNRPGRIRVIGSCNGIIYIQIDQKDMFLWNPCTRKSKAVFLETETAKKGYCYMWGFGYSESEDDYKVVGIFNKSNVSTYTFKTEIYSLKTDSWKRIKNHRGRCIPSDRTGFFTSGKIHFTAYGSADLGWKWNIMSLDLKTEAYGIVKHPDYGDGWSRSYLGTFGGCLGLFCRNQSAKRICLDVWVMKEYGSWTKVVSVPRFIHPYVLDLKPLLITPNGEILLMCSNCVLIYNPRYNNFTCSPISNLSDDNHLKAQIYVESLVSI